MILVIISNNKIAYNTKIANNIPIKQCTKEPNNCNTMYTVI